MKIGIMGGGAIGLFFAVEIAQEFPAVLFTKTIEQANAVTAQGVEVREKGKSAIYSIQAKPSEDALMKEMDLLVIALKQYQLPAAIPVLERLPKETALIFLQNGMGHVEVMDCLKQKNVFAATVEHGVLRTGAAQIEVKGRSRTNIAVVRGSRNAISRFIEKMRDRFPFVWRDDAKWMLLEKLSANVVINPLTAILNSTNGELLTNKHYFRLAQEIFKEFAAVFSEYETEKGWESIQRICQATSGNCSSMLSDLKAGRPTEVDAIIGFVLSEADKNGIAVPALQTVYHMVKGLEKTHAE